jgi:uncharacterized membrane protein YgdD (TMEM256/DUF423 family)
LKIVHDRRWQRRCTPIVERRSLMEDRAARRWIWAMVVVQLAGYVFDAVWHGLIRPGVEPHTVEEMAVHLVTVHLPLYVGAGGVLIAVLAALVRASRRGAVGAALPIALVGSVVSAGAEAWHALSHLQMDTQHAPVAGTLSFVGFLVVVAALRSSSGRHHRADRSASERRAA